MFELNDVRCSGKDFVDLPLGFGFCYGVLVNGMTGLDHDSFARGSPSGSEDAEQACNPKTSIAQDFDKPEVSLKRISG